MQHRREIIEDYNEKYKGLSKQFYKKDWIEKIAKLHKRSIVYTSVNNKNYWNAEYLFNCFIVK